MEQHIVEYDYNRQNKMEEIWVHWLKNKGHLHTDIIVGIKDQWKSRNCSLVLESRDALNPSPYYRAKIFVGLELEVGFNAEAAEPATQSYSGSPASLELVLAKLGELTLSQELFDELLSEHADTIEEACWDKLREEEEEREGCPF